MYIPGPSSENHDHDDGFGLEGSGRDNSTLDASGGDGGTWNRAALSGSGSGLGSGSGGV